MGDGNAMAPLGNKIKSCMRGVIMVEFVSRLGVPDDIIPKIYHALNECLVIVPLLCDPYDMNPVNLVK